LRLQKKSNVKRGRLLEDSDDESGDDDAAEKAPGM